MDDTCQRPKIINSLQELHTPLLHNIEWPCRPLRNDNFVHTAKNGSGCCFDAVKCKIIVEFVIFIEAAVMLVLPTIPAKKQSNSRARHGCQQKL